LIENLLDLSQSNQTLLLPVEHCKHIQGFIFLTSAVKPLPLNHFLGVSQGKTIFIAVK
jgi:hypothetical protein